MKIKVTDTIKDYEGNVVKDEQGKEMTWRYFIFTALNTTLPNEDMNSDEKMKCYSLTNKAYSSDEPDFTVDELSFILTRIKKLIKPLICGRAEELFNKKEASN